MTEITQLNSRSASKKLNKKESYSTAPSDYRFFTADVDVLVGDELVTLQARLYDSEMISTIFDTYLAKLKSTGNKILPGWQWSDFIKVFLVYYSDSLNLSAWLEGYVGPLLQKGGTEMLEFDGDMHLVVLTRNADETVEIEIVKLDGTSVYRRKLRNYMNPKTRAFMWYWIENQSANRADNGIHRPDPALLL